MSERDIDTIRELNSLFNEEPHNIDKWLDYYHRDAVFEMPPEWPDAHVYRGHDGIRKVAEAWLASFDEYRWDEEEIRAVGPSVLALWRHRGRVGSSDWVEREVGSVWTLRDGKVAEIVTFFSWDQARQAADLRAGQA